MAKQFIKLTHLRSEKPTYIDVMSVVSVRENFRGETLVVTSDNRGQYVMEDSALVVDTIESMREVLKGDE